ncbi:hypothetical protein AAZV13_06G020350 [Glycine max]
MWIQGQNQMLLVSRRWSRRRSQMGLLFTMLLCSPSVDSQFSFLVYSYGSLQRYESNFLEYPGSCECERAASYQGIAFLDYYDIPFKVVEVNPINKKEIKWSDYKKVPILTVDGQQMVDSSDIIDKLIKRIHPDYDLNAQEENKWRYYVLLIILRLLGCIQLSLFFTASSLTNSYPLTKLVNIVTNIKFVLFC